MKIKVVSGKKKAPWRNAMPVKIDIRELNVVGEKTNLQVYHDI